ncbi:MAG: hypothetical protein ABJK20_13265, partial [Halieaceae bacterium]
MADEPITPISLEPAGAATNSDAIKPSAFEPLAEASATKTAKVSPLRWLVIAGALCFLLIMAFLFTARSVQITVVAESEPDIDIGGLLIP